MSHVTDERLNARYADGWYYCWLIEWRDGPQPKWLGASTWVTDANEAIWYARKSDADSVWERDLKRTTKVVVCEHGFDLRLRSAPSPLDEGMREDNDSDYRDLLAVLYALRDMTTIPKPRVLNLLSKAGKFPDDWETGKRMQNEHGLDTIPPNTECEIGAGFWKRLSAALSPQEPAAGESEPTVFWAVRNTHEGVDSYLCDTDDGWAWIADANSANRYPTRESADERRAMLARRSSAHIYTLVRVTVWNSNDALSAPLLAAQKDGLDARRYRWLRKGGYPLCEIDDAAIDAAIQLAGKGDL